MKIGFHLHHEGMSREKFWRMKSVFLCFFLRLMGKHMFYIEGRKTVFRKPYPNVIFWKRIHFKVIEVVGKF